MPAASTAVQLTTSTGTLHGTLALPASDARWPVVLLIAGSGPTDRNGNSPLLPGANNSLAMLADGLAARGVASLRCDKRGVGESAGAATREDDLRFTTYADDASAWAAWLRADTRFATTTIAGHSEGSLLGMLASRAGQVDAFVSIAGVGRRADAVIRGQLRAPHVQLPAPLLDEADHALAELVAGRLVPSPPAPLASLFRPSVQPYMISWLSVDPATEIARLTLPVLIVQGTTDIQVGVAEAELLSKAQPAAECVIIEGMNHVLKAVSSDQAAQIASYGDPTLPVVPELIERVASFALRARRRD